jgi:hypothetical protein
MVLTGLLFRDAYFSHHLTKSLSTLGIDIMRIASSNKIVLLLLFSVF